MQRRWEKEKRDICSFSLFSSSYGSPRGGDAAGVKLHLERKKGAAGLGTLTF